MDIHYRLDRMPSPEQVIDLYTNAGLPRPTHDKARIQKMFVHADLVVTAWDGEQLVGLARSINDWVWSCYLADLAVRQEYQKAGVGKALLDLTKQQVGEESMVLLLSVPAAMAYYPKVGMQKVDNGFIIPRTK